MNRLIKRLASLVLTCFIIVPAQADTQIYFIHNDHLGTSQVVTDQSQTVVWEGKQKPFGEVEETTSSIEQLSRFPGQYFDEESGLHYNYFRDYDPTIGRYIQSDPIGLRGGINTYAYVGGNPLMYTDPTGEFAITGGIALGLLGAALLGSTLATNPAVQDALNDVVSDNPLDDIPGLDLPDDFPDRPSDIFPEEIQHCPDSTPPNKPRDQCMFNARIKYGQCLSNPYRNNQGCTAIYLLRILACQVRSPDSGE